MSHHNALPISKAKHSGALIAALDQGTTSSRTLIFNGDNQLIASSQIEFNQSFPHNDWHEQDANELWQSQLTSLEQALSKAGLHWSDLAGIGICNQRESCLAWQRSTGKALTPVIVWQDRRTSQRMQALGQQQRERLESLTGLKADSYFSASKMEWLMAEFQLEPLAELNDLCLGTIDSWLLWQLTAGQCFATDQTNASRTLLYDIKQGAWHPELLAEFNIPGNALAEVKPSMHLYGHSHPSFGAQVPIVAMAGDQQAAAFGQGCWQPGQAKVTYGTGCFLLMPSEQMSLSRHGLLTTLACTSGPLAYALEGSVFMGGALVQWLRDNLGIIQQASDIEPLARTVNQADDLICVPAFAGLGTPYWDPSARGLLVGMTRATNKGHIAYACLEAIAQQCTDVLEAARADGLQLKQIRVDGGACNNDLLMQMQADLCGLQLFRPTQSESTAQGIAWMAGLQLQLFDQQQLNGWLATGRLFKPSLSPTKVMRKRQQWQRALSRARDWHQ